MPIPTLDLLKATYGANECNIPIPKFTELFAEHAVAPFFVFQIFCVALWCLDEYWYYSLFTAFMLVVFECTVVFQVCQVSLFCRKIDLGRIDDHHLQRVKTLTEFRTMSITPYNVMAYRDEKWVEVISSDLVPGDVVSIRKSH